jgi:hypothetical protein
MDRNRLIRWASTRADLEAIRAEDQAVVYLTVNWSVTERSSRNVFAQVVDRLAASRPDGGRISFWFVPGAYEGFRDWLNALGIPSGVVTTGKGTVLWLRNGKVVWSVESAATIGVEKLIAVTVAHFGG